MKVAFESPTRLLQHIQPFADFDWILAHKVLKDKEYKEWYSKSSRIKFVDNSVNELGEPLGLEDLKKAYEEVSGTYLVAPDWLGNSSKTTKAYEDCLKEFGDKRVVGVVQGSTFTEALECIEYYLSKEAKPYLAIPYDICSKKEDPPWLMSLRRVLVVTHIPPEAMVHLLGFTSLDEFFWYTRRPNVASIDTGVPILLGLMEKDILDPLESKVTPTFNDMEKLELGKNSWTAICRNIALFRRYLP